MTSEEDKKAQAAKSAKEAIRKIEESWAAKGKEKPEEPRESRIGVNLKRPAEDQERTADEEDSEQRETEGREMVEQGGNKKRSDEKEVPEEEPEGREQRLEEVLEKGEGNGRKKKKHVLTEYRKTDDEIREDEKISKFYLPDIIIYSLALVTIVLTAMSILSLMAGAESKLLYTLTIVAWSSGLIILITGLRVVRRPEEWIIDYFGEFYKRAKPGLLVLLPGIMTVVSKVKVMTSQPIDLFREESAPVIFADGVTAKVKSTVIIKIYDAYNVTYNLHAHLDFITQRQKIGVIHPPDQSYFYAIEEILDSLIRGFFGGLDIEKVLEMRAVTSGAGTEEKIAIKTEIVNKIEQMADAMLKPFGVDVESILFPEIDIVEEDIIEKLQEKFKAKQNIEIQELQVRVEEKIVKVEEQKALQEEQKGIGAGKFVSKQIDAVRDAGVDPMTAANVVTTRMWTDAAQKGAKLNIIATAENGKMQTPIMTGIGMGMGQNLAEETGKKEVISEEKSSKEKSQAKVEKKETLVKPEEDEEE